MSTSSLINREIDITRDPDAHARVPVQTNNRFSKFKVGDRVRCTRDAYTASQWGPGTILNFNHERPNSGMTIRFDNGKHGFLFDGELTKV